MQLKYIYTFFLGLLLAIFVGLGIATFYPPPAMPQYPVELNTISTKEPNVAELKVQRAYDVKMQHYNEIMKPYNRNVSIIALVSSVVLMAVGLIFESRIKILADGLLLGGVFTLIYSIGRSFASENSKYSFGVVTVALVITFFLGYIKFISPRLVNETQPSKNVKK